MKLSGGTGCANSYLATTSMGEGGTALCGGRRGIALSATRRNFFRRSGMGKTCADAHPRHVAVALRQRAAFFCCAPRRGKHHERPLPQKALRLRDRSVGFWFSNCGPARPQADSSKVDGVRMRHTTQYANMAKPSAVTFFP